jgi:hypothetical protein
MATNCLRNFDEISSLDVLQTRPAVPVDGLQVVKTAVYRRDLYTICVM